MTHLAILTTLAIMMSGVQTLAPKPTVVPLLSESSGSGFVIETQNTTGADFKVLPGGLCRYRIDGVMERDGSGGSGGAVIAKAGASWLEAIRLVASPRDPGTRRGNPLVGTVASYREATVKLSTGRHVIAFRCGEGWSDDVPFFWLDAVK